MPRTLVYFDGHCLSDYFHVHDVKRQHAGHAVNARSVPGMDGAVFVSSTLAPIAVSMRLTALQPTREERMAAIRDLYGWLDVRDPRRLEFTDEEGRYWMAVPRSMGQHRRWATADAVQAVEFFIPDPVMYGELRTVAVASGQSATFEVGGTYPARASVAASAARRDSSAGRWAVRFDNADAMALALGDNSAHAVSIDADARVARVDGAAVLPTADTDWAELAPGTHSVAEVGTGAYSVTWQERWV